LSFDVGLGGFCMVFGYVECGQLVEKVMYEMTQIRMQKTKQLNTVVLGFLNQENLKAFSPIRIG